MHVQRLAVLACLGVVAACATTWDVDRFEADDANLAARRSFAWQGTEVSTPTVVSPGMERDIAAQVRQAVVTELAAKGYAEVTDAADADMLVSCQVAGNQRFETSKDRRIGAPSPTQVLTPGNAPLPPASLPPREVSIREGSVIVFVAEPASGRLIWRGLVAEETRVSSDEAGIRLVAEMARHIAREFPARAAPRPGQRP
jgi:hypothetical protein